MADTDISTDDCHIELEWDVSSSAIISGNGSGNGNKVVIYPYLHAFSLDGLRIISASADSC